MKLVTLYLPEGAPLLGTLADLIGVAQELGVPLPAEEVVIDGRTATKVIVPLGEQPLTVSLPGFPGVAVGLADAGETVALVVPSKVSLLVRLALGRAVAWVTVDPERPELSRIGLNLTPGVVTWLKASGGVAVGLSC